MEELEELEPEELVARELVAKEQVQHENDEWEAYFVFIVLFPSGRKAERGEKFERERRIEIYVGLFLEPVLI